MENIGRRVSQIAREKEICHLSITIRVDISVFSLKMSVANIEVMSSFSGGN